MSDPDSREIIENGNVSEMVELFRTSELSTCLDVKIALVKIGSDAVGALLPALKDQDEKVRSWAAQTLADIRDPRSVDALIEALNDADHPLDYAAMALGRIRDPKAIVHLVHALNSSHQTVANAASFALGFFEDNQVVESLLDLLSGRDHQIKLNAIEGLARRTDHRVILALADQLQDNSWSIRAKAAWALGEIGKKGLNGSDMDMIETSLNSMLDDPYRSEDAYPEPNYPVRIEAERALKKIDNNGN